MIISEIVAKWNNLERVYEPVWSYPFEATQEYINTQLEHAQENKASYYYKIIEK